MIRPFQGLFQRISRQLSALVESLPLDSEEKTRLRHFMAFLWLGVPTMLAFGIYNCWKSNWILSAVIFAMALSLMLAWSLLKRLRSGIWLYRLNTLFFGGMLLFMVILGGEGGAKALWLFTFPLVAFFLLSTIEGLAWTLVLFLAVVCVFWLPYLGLPIHRYQGQFIARFSAVYFIISVLAFWFEYLRQHYRQGMELEHQRLQAERSALQEALSKVRQLSGMLPICASCKKVRDDQGYWTQIEAYISNHSEAEFSHGICPDCGDDLYPGVYRKSQQRD
jgi:hypothetical protein